MLLTDLRKRNQKGLAVVDVGTQTIDHCNDGRRSLFSASMIGITTACIVVLCFSLLLGNIDIPHNRRLQSEEAVDDIDFSGGHNADRSYRLGDVFVMWYTTWKTFDKLLEIYARDYPNTLAHRYLLEVGEEQYGNRNLTALLRVIEQYKHENKEKHFLAARDDDLVVHVRLGDVLTDDEYTDTSVPMIDLWNQEEGFVIKDGGEKYDYNKAEFLELFSRIPKNATINRVVIVGAGHNTDEEHDNRNKQYKELVASLMAETFSCPVAFYTPTADNPDTALMYMASANWLIAGMGGYAQIAAACVNARRGHGHSIFDKFNGEIASWNYKKLTPKEKEIYRDSYVDWSRHDVRLSV